jgi:hypothetical protein
MLCWIAGRNEQRFGTGSARRTVPLKLLYPDAVKASLRQLELDGVRLGLGEGEQTTRNTFYENSSQTGLPLVSIFPQPGLPEGVLTFFIRYAFRYPGRAVPPHRGNAFLGPPPREKTFGQGKQDRLWLTFHMVIVLA